MSEGMVTGREGFELYPGDWVVVEQSLLKIEGEVDKTFEKAGRVKVRVDGARNVLVKADDCRLHRLGRPSLRHENFGRFH